MKQSFDDCLGAAWRLMNAVISSYQYADPKAYLMSMGWNSGEIAKIQHQLTILRKELEKESQ